MALVGGIIIPLFMLLKNNEILLLTIHLFPVYSNTKL